MNSLSAFEKQEITRFKNYIAQHADLEELWNFYYEEPSDSAQDYEHQKKIVATAEEWFYDFLAFEKRQGTDILNKLDRQCRQYQKYLEIEGKALLRLHRCWRVFPVENGYKRLSFEDLVDENQASLSPPKELALCIEKWNSLQCLRDSSSPLNFFKKYASFDTQKLLQSNEGSDWKTYAKNLAYIFLSLFFGLGLLLAKKNKGTLAFWQSPQTPAKRLSTTVEEAKEKYLSCST